MTVGQKENLFQELAILKTKVLTNWYLLVWDSKVIFMWNLVDNRVPGTIWYLTGMGQQGGSSRWNF